MKTATKFMADIEEIRSENSDLSYMDAVLHYCDAHGIEYETAGTLVKSIPVLKAKIQAEAENLHFLPKTSKLPVEE